MKFNSLLHHITIHWSRIPATVGIMLTLLASAHAEHFKHLSIAQGLSQPSVMAISQDRLGRMWFGTKEGVNVFDGHSVIAYKGWIKDWQTDSDIWIGNDVSSICNDSTGNIFMLIDRDVVRFDLRKERFSLLTSSYAVSALAEHNGNIVFISNDSLYIKDKLTDRISFIVKSKILSNASQLTVSDRNFYISTNSGLAVIDRRSHTKRILLNGIPVYSSFISRDGTLWISAVKSGLFRLRGGEKIPVQVSMPTLHKGARGSDQTRLAAEDRSGKIWYGSFSGLFCYDPSTDMTKHLAIPAILDGLSHSSIFSVFCDNNGTIWVGSYYGGVNYFTPDHDRFFNFDYVSLSPPGLYHSFIIDMEYDRDGNLWLGTDGGGVTCVDHDWNLKLQLTTLSGAGPLRQNNVKTMAYDPSTNRIFIGTHLGGLSYYDISSGTTVNLIDSKGPESGIGDIIHNLKVFRGKLYVSSNAGLSTIDLTTDRITKISGELIPQFDFDKNGNIWYYVFNGAKLHVLPAQGNSKVCIPDFIKDNIFSNPSRIICTDIGVIVATLGHGLFLYPYGQKKAVNFNTSNSKLPSDYCYAIAKGRNGNVFVTTEKEIVKFNPSTKEIKAINFATFNPTGDIIFECGLMASDDGSLLVGTTKGITVLSEDVFNEKPTVRDSSSNDIFFSRLTIGSRAIVPGDETGALKETLPLADEIRLGPDDKSFGIWISECDFINPETADKYQYRLDGVDRDWQTANNGYIHYTNLSPGSYTLHARKTPPNPGEESPEISLKVVVDAPWYATKWAYLVYFVLIGSILWYLVIKSRNAARLRLSLEKEKLERRQIEKLNHEKLVFFTNVSHEFQTPLVLILSHIDILISKNARNERVVTHLKRVRRHAEHLSHLITQLLEFRKLQQNKQVLKIGRHDACRILERIATPFSEYALKRNIDFRLQVPENPVYGYFDPWLIDRVLVNILSNAFKYTPDGGAITCRVSQAPDGDVLCSFTDTGKGIPSNELPFIFEQYYNGSADELKHTDLNYKSTGIGLAFAKSIMDSHHGSISVESREGEGSTFTVRIPGTQTPFGNDRNVEFDHSAVNASEIALPSQELPLASAVTEPSGNNPVEEDDTDKEDGDRKPMMMIVEDNRELCENLASYFSSYYRVRLAGDGEEALERIRHEQPDIIISDVMMPKMNGFDLCRRIKLDIELCHIPVILLTALNASESRLEGFNANADAYVTKPFDFPVLLAQIDNLLRRRRMLQRQIEKKPVSEIDVTVINPIDRNLLKRATDIIESHIAEQELDIPLLCRELAISRSLFYSKFKALTGMTPNAFILNYRLRHAAAMLAAQPHVSITEVAELSGFASAVYFSRCFKKQYGVSPQKYQSLRGEIPPGDLTT